MASETKRGCGYRKVGGLYLCGGGLWVSCDRLPYELKSCPVCGAGVHFTRSMTEINPLRLFGSHDGELRWQRDASGNSDIPLCQDEFRPCKMCDPTEEPAYIMTVGRKYYSPESFVKEALELGVSKRIASNSIPKKLKLGQTVIYLAHPEAVNGTETPRTQGELLGNGQVRLLDAEKAERKLGIFCAFTPQRVEMLVWESELEGEQGELYKASLEKRGITPVPIPDNDPDHTSPPPF